jgi:hypothetical protein
MVYLVASTASAVSGFLVGLFAFKIKSRWCPDCGRWTWHRVTGNPTSEYSL